MGTEDSPSLDEFAQGIPDELPDPSKNKDDCGLSSEFWAR
jgi:hypothetical protein